MSSYDFLARLLASEFGVRPEEISPESTLASLGLDSLSMAEMIREIEEEYGIAISAADAGFGTLSEAAALVDRLVAEQGA